MEMIRYHPKRWTEVIFGIHRSPILNRLLVFVVLVGAYLADAVNAMLETHAIAPAQVEAIAAANSIEDMFDRLEAVPTRDLFVASRVAAGF